MPPRSGASDLAITIALAASLALSGVSFVGCTKPLAPVEDRKAPPRVLSVTFEQVQLRADAWVELHAWLATAARSDLELPEPMLARAAHAYRTALEADPRDEALWTTTRALAACDDATCAEHAVTGSAFANAYLDSLPIFLDRFWIQRAAVARAGIESAQAALGETLPVLVARLAKDLAIEWPKTPPIVDIVGDSPEAGPEAPLRMAITARGACFAGTAAEPRSMHDARITDCVLSYAAIGLASTSALAEELGATLRANNHGQDFDRAWKGVVVHAVASILTVIDRRHSSVLRRAAAGLMPQAMGWLAQEWPARMKGEPATSFAKRYAEVVAHGSP